MADFHLMFSREDKRQFRTVVDVTFPKGYSTRKIDVDIRYGNETAYGHIVDESLKKHEQCKVQKCSHRDEIQNCEFLLVT